MEENTKGGAGWFVTWDFCPSFYKLEILVLGKGVKSEVKVRELAQWVKYLLETLRPEDGCPACLVWKFRFVIPELASQPNRINLQVQ